MCLGDLLFGPKKYVLFLTAEAARVFLPDLCSVHYAKCRVIIVSIISSILQLH